MEQQLRVLLREKGGDVVSIGPDVSVLEAVRVMNEVGIGSVVVVEDEKPIGIFTERDVLRRVVDGMRDAGSTPVKDVMTSRLVVVSSDETIHQAMSIMTLKRCRHLPVIDDDKLVGLISIGDLMHWVSKSQRVELVDLKDYITGRYPV